MIPLATNLWPFFSHNLIGACGSCSLCSGRPRHQFLKFLQSTGASQCPKLLCDDEQVAPASRTKDLITKSYHRQSWQPRDEWVVLEDQVILKNICSSESMERLLLRRRGEMYVYQCEVCYSHLLIWLFVSMNRWTDITSIFYICYVCPYKLT